MVAQSSSFKTIEEHRIYYKDSIENNITYGTYEPTDLIGLDDNSLIISSSFSISFPGQYSTPSEYSKEYLSIQKEMYSKSHTSSGSIIKLNKEFKKEWELIFKEKRVERIKMTTSGKIIAVGERTDMEKFWVSLISINGKIIWEKEFKNKKESTITDIDLDSLDNLFVLLESKRIIPVKTIKYPYQKRRLVLFQKSEENGIYLTKIDSTGKTKWTKRIFQKRNFDSYGSDIKLNHNKIFISYSYEGYKRVNDSLAKDEAKIVTALNHSGKIIKNLKTTNNKLLFSKKDVINVSGESNNENELVIEKDFKTFKTLTIPDEIEHYWLKEGIKTNIGYYLFGTNDHNLGYLILGLDRDYGLINYWKSETSNGEDATAITIQSDGSIIVVGEKTDKNIKLPYGNATYIDIIKLKNGV